MTSTVIGLISFAFTIATFVNVFWSSVQTIRAAPSEIGDYLSSLKQGLLEERRHLRKVGKRMRSARRGRSGSDPGGDGRGSKRRHSGGRVRRAQFERDEQVSRSQGEGDSLRTLRTTVRDIIRSFRQLEYPFLKPEYQNVDSAHWTSNTPTPLEKLPSYPQHSPYTSLYPAPDDNDPETVGFGSSNRFGNEYRVCGFRERWIWLRRKQDVVRLSEVLNRVEVRRVSHEVGRAVMMLGDIGQDVEDVRDGVGRLEERLGRIVGVRRVD